MSFLRRRRRAVAITGAALIAGSTVALATSSSAISLPAPPAAAVAFAVAEPCLDFARKAGPPVTDPAGHPPVPISNANANGGATLVLAVAAQHGDVRAKRALLRQVLHIVVPSKTCTRAAVNRSRGEPTAAGGVTAQEELWATAMLAVVRHTPAVWKAIPGWERERIDLVMRAELVSNAFATSDADPYVNPPALERTIDGGTNVGRDWNANYREGMLGQVLTAVAYFGRDRARRELTRWDRSTFLSDVRRRHLHQLETTFSWGEHHPSAGVPTDADVDAANTRWSYHGLTLAQPMELYADLTTFTFGLPVACGVADAGNPPGSAGRPADANACATWPQLGQPGMIREFDTHDAGGVRSSSIYAYLAFRSSLATQVAMLASGLWKAGPIGAGPSATTTGRLLALQRVGTADLFLKLKAGYLSYANGETKLSPIAASGVPAPGGAEHGFQYTEALWADVVLKTPRLESRP